MADFATSETLRNLQEALLAEGAANRRYLWFAQRADVDGYPDIAALFRSVAESETGHAFGLLDFLADAEDDLSGELLGDTDANLRAAIAAERRDAAERYPAFAETARAEGFDEIADWMDTLAQAEEAHAARFEEGLGSLG